jgi:hypothetical protein
LSRGEVLLLIAAVKTFRAVVCHKNSLTSFGLTNQAGHARIGHLSEWKEGDCDAAGGPFFVIRAIPLLTAMKTSHSDRSPYFALSQAADTHGNSQSRPVRNLYRGPGAFTAFPRPTHTFFLVCSSSDRRKWIPKLELDFNKLV